MERKSVKNLHLLKKLGLLLTGEFICLTMTGCDSQTLGELKTWIDNLDNLNIEVHIDNETITSESTTSNVTDTTTSYTTTTPISGFTTTSLSSMLTTTTSVPILSTLNTTTESTKDITTTNVTTTETTKKSMSTTTTTNTTTMTTTTATTKEDDLVLYHSDCLFEEAEYLVQSNDTIYSLARKFNTTEQELRERNNLVNNDIYAGKTVIKYGVINQYASYKKNQSLIQFASENLADLNEIRKLNNISDDVLKLSSDRNLVVRRLVGNEKECYNTLGTKLNYVQGSLIPGDKIFVPTGYPGASNNVLALINSQLEFGYNYVYLYSFDGCGNYNIFDVATNVKDIGVYHEYDQIPIIYLRSKEDVLKLANEANVSLDDSYAQSFRTTLYNNLNDERTYFVDQNDSAFVSWNSDFDLFIESDMISIDDTYVSNSKKRAYTLH